MSMTRRVLSILVLLVPVSVLAQDSPNTRKAQPPVGPDPRPSPLPETPLSRALIAEGYSPLRLKRDKLTDQLYVECRANGQTLCLLLDTGATHSALSIDKARELKLTLKEMKGQVTGVGSGHDFVTTRIDEFKISGLLPIYLDVAVLNSSTSERQ